MHIIDYKSLWINPKAEFSIFSLRFFECKAYQKGKDKNIFEKLAYYIGNSTLRCSLAYLTLEGWDVDRKSFREMIFNYNMYKIDEYSRDY